MNTRLRAALNHTEGERARLRTNLTELLDAVNQVLRLPAVQRIEAAPIGLLEARSFDAADTLRAVGAVPTAVDVEPGQQQI